MLFLLLVALHNIPHWGASGAPRWGAGRGCPGVAVVSNRANFNFYAAFLSAF